MMGEVRMVRPNQDMSGAAPKAIAARGRTHGTWTPTRLAIIGVLLLAAGWLAWVVFFSGRASLAAAQAEEQRRQRQLREQYPTPENAEPVHMPGHLPPT